MGVGPGQQAQTDFEGWRLWGPTLAGLALLAVGLLASQLDASPWWSVWLRWLGLLVLTVAIIHIFTASVDPRRINQIVRLSYAFGLLTLVGSLVVLATFYVADYSRPAGAAGHGALGLLESCSAAEGQKPASIPLEIRCSAGARQWVIHLGGSVVERQIVELEGEDVALEGAIRKESEEALEAARGTELGELQEDLRESATDLAALADAAALPRPRVEIVNGLVVPLYFVVLALVGAAIGLLRRVPEYHKRVLPAYGTFYQHNVAQMPDLKRPLEHEETREFLVFQNLQVVAAPIIGGVAYFLITPDERAVAVALAFVSGFSSESVLIVIRNVTDRLQSVWKR